MPTRRHTRNEGKAPKRAAGYVRVSQVGGRHGESFLSPELQREKIEAWASYRDYHIVKWYVDLDVSGRTGVRRPEFERLMQDAREGKFDAVAVYRLTRFARSVQDAAARYSELRELNVGLVSVTEDIDTTTASGQFMQNIMFAMAEFESQRIGEEWRNVHARRRAMGYVHVPRPVTGYRQSVDGDGKGSATLDVVEPLEAQAIRKMYVMRAQGAGYGEIRTALQTEGYTSRNGHSRFAQSTISGILRNPIYAGLVESGEELIEGKHEAIVSRELWDRVQQMQGDVSSQNRHHSALLAGLLVCSSCGYRMHYERYRRRRQNGYVQPAGYRCPGRQRADGCQNPMHIHADYVEEYVEELFLRRFSSKRMPHGGQLTRTRQQRVWQAELTRARARINDLNRALDGLSDQRYVKGSIEQAEFERTQARYLTERAGLEARVDELDRMLNTVTPIRKDVLELWPHLTVAERRRAFRIAIGTVTIHPSPRRGRGQRALMPKRVQVGWLQ